MAPTAGDTAARFGKWLKEERQLRFVSARELAERAGLSYVSVFRFERGEQTPTRQTVIRIANALESTPGNEQVSNTDMVDEGLRYAGYLPLGDAIEARIVQDQEFAEIRKRTMEISRVPSYEWMAPPEGFDELPVDEQKLAYGIYADAVNRFRARQRAKENLGGSVALEEFPPEEESGDQP